MYPLEIFLFREKYFILQAGCALFSWQRYRQGFESAFTDIPVGGEAGYQSQEPPFQQSGKIDLFYQVLSPKYKLF